MRALVTGGAGFLGSHLVNRLEDEGWDVVVIDDYSTHPASTRPHDDVRLQRIQDANPYTVEKLDAVFHLAGKLGPVGVLRFAGNIANDTIMAADRAAYFSEVHKCPLIDISTSEVYGSPDSANSESTPSLFQPGHTARMEYAVSKRAAEVMLQNRPGLDVRIVRPFNITGPRQRPEGGFVLPRFVQQALKNETLTVYAPGTQRRAFTHVLDIVDGIMLAYKSGKKGEVYNLGNPTNACSILDLAAEVLIHINTSSSVINLVDPTELWGKDFVEAPEKLPNADKAIKELGWVPWRGRQRIIQDTAEYWHGRV